MDLVLEASQLDPLSSIIAVLTGFILIIAGRLVIKTLVSLLFGVGACYITYSLLKPINIAIPTILFVCVVVFLVSYFIGWFLLKLSISIVTGQILGVVLIEMLGLHGNMLLSLLVIILIIAIVYALVEKTIMIASILSGIALTILGLSNLTRSSIATTILTITLLSVGLYFKIKFR